MPSGGVASAQTMFRASPPGPSLTACSKAQQLQLAGGLAEARGSLLDITACHLLTLDWCCTSSTKRVNSVAILQLILQEQTHLQQTGDGPRWQQGFALGHTWQLVQSCHLQHRQASDACRSLQPQQCDCPSALRGSGALACTAGPSNIDKALGRGPAESEIKHARYLLILFY